MLGNSSKNKTGKKEDEVLEMVKMKIWVTAQCLAVTLLYG